MHSAVSDMLNHYAPQTVDETVRALREILQQVALLGLWRGGFFRQAAFYGGTALRLLNGLDRFSEDLDFSLLHPDPAFSFTAYAPGLRDELAAFGFDLSMESRPPGNSAIRSAFLKGDTRQQLLVLSAGDALTRLIPHGQKVTIKLEVDIDPPPGFITEMRYLFRPVPFAVRAYAMPDMLAGKMHAALCRGWKNRVKGRDWYDLAWYAGHAPEIRLSHLEQRMRQSGHWSEITPLTEAAWRQRMAERIATLDIDQARREVERFVADPRSLDIWSQAFFMSAAEQIRVAP